MKEWNKLGEVSVDIGMMLITDADNFAPINEIHDGDWDEDLIEKDFSIYSVPWLGGDGNWSYYGLKSSDINHKSSPQIDNYFEIDKTIEKKIRLDLKDNYDYILIHNHTDSLSEKSNIEINKICEIMVHSGKIAINDPCKAFYRDTGFYRDKKKLKTENVITLNDGIKKISIYETSLGTLIQLNPNVIITNQDFYELVSFKDSLIDINNSDVFVFYSLVRNRYEFYLPRKFWTKKELSNNLNNGFDGKIKHFFERGHELTLVIMESENEHDKLTNKKYLSNSDLKEALEIFCRDNDRKFIKDEDSNRYSIAFTILALASGFSAISETEKKLKG